MICSRHDRDDIATRLLARPIVLGLNGEPISQADVTDALIPRHKIADRVRAIVHDDQFHVGIVLTQEILDRARHERPALYVGMMQETQGCRSVVPSTRIIWKSR